jgi:L,D-peptidoglycan transpeptidase YkuD (ErfK/YbiS/YcfS/YnhG family)
MYSTSYGTGSMYVKTNGEWKKLSEFSVRLGSNGMSYTRVQNSNKTPAGVLNIISAFGVAANPGI